jgi:EF-hand domain-containing protein 1
MERSLGGGRVASQKQFLDHDRKVLRFFCISEDLPFIVNYFLADDTVEIREVHHPNDGRDSFPLLLRRQRIPFSHEVKQPGFAFIGDNYLTCDEIEPSGSIFAFGRPFYITGVDQYTQEYYASKYGKFFELSSIQMPPARPPVEKQIPPYNGFG